MTREQEIKATSFARYDNGGMTIGILFKSMHLNTDDFVNAVCGRIPRQEVARLLRASMQEVERKTILRLAEKTMAAVNKAVVHDSISVHEAEQLIRRKFKIVWVGYDEIEGQLLAG